MDGGATVWGRKANVNCRLLGGSAHGHIMRGSGVYNSWGAWWVSLYVV